MAYPVKVYPRNEGPKWLDGLQKYVEKPRSEETTKKDNAATVRNHGGDRATIDDDTYVDKGK